MARKVKGFSTDRANESATTFMCQRGTCEGLRRLGGRGLSSRDVHGTETELSLCSGESLAYDHAMTVSAVLPPQQSPDQASPRRICVIFNPAAGRNRRPRLNAVIAALAARGCAVDVKE